MMERIKEEERGRETRERERTERERERGERGRERERDQVLPQLIVRGVAAVVYHFLHSLLGTMHKCE
jgi:hypothetical protein